MKFRLAGRIDYAVGSCHDDRSIAITQFFDGSDDGVGKREGRMRARALYKENKDRTDFGMMLILSQGKRKLLEFYAVAEQPARPLQRARKAIRARLAEKHF